MQRNELIKFMYENRALVNRYEITLSVFCLNIRTENSSIGIGFYNTLCIKENNSYFDFRTEHGVITVFKEFTHMSTVIYA